MHVFRLTLTPSKGGTAAHQTSWSCNARYYGSNMHDDKATWPRKQADLSTTACKPLRIKAHVLSQHRPSYSWQGTSLASKQQRACDAHQYTGGQDEFAPSMSALPSRSQQCAASPVFPGLGMDGQRLDLYCWPHTGNAAARTFQVPLVATAARSCRSIQITDCSPTDRAIWPARSASLELRTNCAFPRLAPHLSYPSIIALRAVQHCVPAVANMPCWRHMHAAAVSIASRRP